MDTPNKHALVTLAEAIGVAAQSAPFFPAGLRDNLTTAAEFAGAVAAEVDAIRKDAGAMALAVVARADATTEEVKALAMRQSIDAQELREAALAQDQRINSLAIELAQLRREFEAFKAAQAGTAPAQG